VRPGSEPTYQVYPATALEGPVYRVVGKCPPTADDFVSYLVAGRGFSDGMFFRATGVSMFTKKKAAAKLAKSGYLGYCVAELNVDNETIFVALTNSQTGHIDVWARPRVLLNCGVNCVDTREA
jgi:hypothetical protein